MRFFLALRLLVHSSSSYSQSKAPFFLLGTYWEHGGKCDGNTMGTKKI